jgi:hypothetical protein
MLGDLFGPGLEGEELKEELMHSLHAFKGGKLEELSSFFLFGNVHDRFHIWIRTRFGVRY